MPTHLEQQYQQLCLRGIDEMGSGSIPRITLGSIVSAGDLLIQFNFGIPFLHDDGCSTARETSNAVLHKYATRYIFLLILD